MTGIFYYRFFIITYYFSLVSFFLAYPMQLQFITNTETTILFFAAVFLSAFVQKRKRLGILVKVIALLLPFASLLWETTIFGRLEFAFAWLLLLIFVMKGVEQPDKERLLAQWKGLLLLYLLPVAMFCIDSERGRDAFEVSAIYVILLATAGVLMLQAMRYEEESQNKKQYERYQLLQTGVFFIACILVMIGKIIPRLWELIRNWLLVPIWNAITDFFLWLASLIDISIQLPKLKPRVFDDFNEYMDIITSQMATQQIQVMQEYQEPEQVVYDWTGTFVVMAAVVGAVMIVILFLNKRKKTTQSTVAEEREEILPEKKIKKKKGLLPDPEQVIRKKYREFMKEADLCEERLRQSDTTKEIQLKYSRMSSGQEETTNEITSLYRDVRYGKKIATKENADQMKRKIKELQHTLYKRR